VKLASALWAEFVSCPSLSEPLPEGLGQLPAETRVAAAAWWPDPDADGVPVLIVMSDNGPQDALALHQRSWWPPARSRNASPGPGTTQPTRPGSKTLFGHVKGEWPHLSKIRDAGELSLELDRVREQYNTGLGYVTPDDKQPRPRRRPPPSPPQRPRGGTTSPDRPPSI